MDSIKTRLESSEMYKIRTLYTGASFIALEISAVIFLKGSDEHKFLSSPKSSQIVSIRGTVWYTNFEPCKMALENERIVYMFIFSPLFDCSDEDRALKHSS